MNYTRARNPERLLTLLEPDGLISGHPVVGPDGLISDHPAVGPDGLMLPSPAAESRFMSALHSLRAEDLRPLLIIVGGFMDAKHGNAYTILHKLSPEFKARHDIYYREHPESASVREVVELYARRGKQITLLGHSWGADAVVHGVACKTRARIDLLITLDPVSRKGAPERCPESVVHWRNIYLDYHCVTWLNSSNNVARIGGPWEAVACAHENRLASHDIAHNNGVALACAAFPEGIC